MLGSDRFNVFPTRGNLVHMYNRLSIAEKGYSLLERKTEALKMRFVVLVKNLIEMKLKFSQNWQNWQFSLIEAKFHAGSGIDEVVLQSVKLAQIKVFSKFENVAGVHFPIFELFKVNSDSNELLGLSRGGQALQKVKKNFQNAIQILVEMASLQTSFVCLDEVIKVMSRRTNAIKIIIIPKFNRTINYILNELAEQEREDFYRMKLVKSKKLKMQLAKKNQVNHNENESENENAIIDVIPIHNILDEYKTDGDDFMVFV